MRWLACWVAVLAFATAACGAGEVTGTPAAGVGRRPVAPAAVTATTTTTSEPPAVPGEPPVPASAATAEHAVPVAPAPAATPHATGRVKPVVKRPPERPSRTASGAPAPSPPPTSTAVHPDDFPDPFVLRAGTYWYAFATQRGLTQVPVMRSADLAHWEQRGDALPTLPAWAQFGFVWAPSVLARDVDGFVLYYTTRHAESGLQCLSRAVSLLPEGPYVDRSFEPLVCQTDRGGSIDASPFRAADGWPWLVWKSEGTLEGEPTRIWSAALSFDGESLGGPPHELLRTELSWEQPIVEAPTMVLDGDRLHLLYSGNRWETSSYAVGHARCDAPSGPCRRVARAPVLASDHARAGPGGAEVFRDLDGSYLLAYHAWPATAVGYPAGARRLHIDRLRFDGDRAVVTPRRVATL